MSAPETEQPLAAEALPSPTKMFAQALAVYAALLSLLVFDDGGRFLAWTRAWPIAGQLAVRVSLPMLVGLAATWLFARNDAHPRRALGLEPMPLARALALGGLGFLFAYAGNASLGGTYLLVTRTPITELMKQRGPVLDLLAQTPLWMVLPLAIVVGIYEELIFRGFILGRLRHAFRNRAYTPRLVEAYAVVLSAALFGTLHAYQGLYGVFQTFGAGLGLGILASWKRSTWPCMVAHALVDALGLFALHFLAPMLDRLAHLPPPH